MNNKYTLGLVIAVMLFTLIIRGDGRDSDGMNSIAPASGATSLERVLQAGVLRCGYMNYAPYFEIDLNSGNPKGVSVDMMKSIGEKMGVSIEWTQETGFGTFIEDIKSNRIDAVCTPVWKNTTRALQISFSIPYGYQTVDAWVRSDDHGKYSLDSMNDESITISVTDGEMGEVIANQSFSKAKHFSIPQSSPFSDLLLNVTTGKADVVFAERQYVEKFMKTNNSALKKVPLDKPLRAFPITLAFSQDDVHLKSAVNAALEEMMNTSEMDDIVMKYDGGLFEKPRRLF